MNYLKSGLCSSCSAIFRSTGEGVLFDSNNMNESSPVTCPVCAIIEFDCSINETHINKVRYRTEAEPTGKSFLELHFIGGHGYDHFQRLKILPVNEVIEEPHWSKVLSRQTLTEESTTFLKERLRDCLEQHHDCQRDLGARPTRLLRIERLQGQDVRVYLNNDCESEVSAYVTLSHCWGNVQPIKLTQATEAELLAGLPTHRLPKTFKDAVFVCEQLNVDYLWIDSLCIFQDDLKDWAQEAATMRLVYSNALCNIAATGASDSSIGLSFERNQLAHRPFRITTSSDQQVWVFPPDWTGETISNSPLNRRAWVMQERFLSNRVLHFTIEGVYWECSTTVATEAYPTVPPHQSFYNFDHELWLKKEIELSKLEPIVIEAGIRGFFYHCWLYTLSRYTKCGITKNTDKLVALSGIAQRLKEAIGVNFVCGMWANLLIRELLWQVDSGSKRFDPPPLPEWRAPSWSWASANYRLANVPYQFDHRGCDSAREIAEVTKTDVNALPSGQLVQATLILRGAFVQAKVHMGNYVWWNHPTGVVKCEHGQTQLVGGSFIFDRLPLFPYEEELTFIALMGCCCTEGTEPRKPEPSIAALMLRRLRTTPTTYSRIGVLRLRGYEACEFYRENQSVDEEEFVVV